MTSTEVEVHEGSQIITRHDLRNAATDSWTDVLEEVGDLASRIVGTDFVPDAFRGSVPAIAATILTGRELGFAPMTALASLHSIKGKVGLAAEAMRALVLQAGHEIVTTTSTSQQCTMKGRRRDSQEWTEVTWTIADARQAGLLNGSGWKNYPRQMLQARASSELCRLAFPDVIRGLASTEEIADYDVLPGAPAAETTNEGTDKPVKRAARKRATTPKAEPAAPPPLPDDETPAAAEARAGEAPPPDLPEPTSPPAETADDSAAATPRPEAATAPADDEGPGEEPAGGEVPDDIVDADVVEEHDPFEDLPINNGQRSLVMVHFNRLGITERDDRLSMACRIIGRQIESSNDLTFKEATALLHVLESVKDAAALADLVQATTTQEGA